MSGELIPVSFSQIDHWREDDHLAAYNCFRLSAQRFAKKPYKTKKLQVSAKHLSAIAQKALQQKFSNGLAARKFFEANFTPHKFVSHSFAGMLTGYYEPELTASRTRTARYKYPLYRRPEDLVDLNETNRPADIERSFAFGRQSPSGIEKFYDRQQIHEGALSNRGLELVWLDNPIDVFFIHIQGSARLTFEDGTFMRVSYSAKSGHPYTAIGKVLVEAGHLQLEDVTMQKIRHWLRANPKQIHKIFAHNRSYIFFQETDRTNIYSGPVAAAGVPLTAGRSLAIDHRLHTFATPIWVRTKENFVAQNKPFSRLLIAQDTGSAITGSQRGDLFVGSGHEAGLFAGQIKHPISMTILAPNNDARQ